MNNLKKLARHRIYLFEPNTISVQSNTLKEFIYFLKYIGNSQINFSFSSQLDTLHPELTIKENFSLDSIPTSLIKDNDNNVFDFLTQLQNPYLKELINEIGDLDRKVVELTKSEIGLTSIVKSVLSLSDYIFLNNPELHMTPSVLNTIKKCMNFEATERDRSILIKSSRRVLWPDIVTIIVSKNIKLEFIVTKNPLNQVERRIPTREGLSIPHYSLKKIS